MDGTVNDFFNEIDQIAPPKEPKTESVWQECYDNSSGYAYYWNFKTDEVTWEIPEEYKLWKERNVPSKSGGNISVPPKSIPLFPSTAPTNTKIYKIQEDSRICDLDNLKSNVQKRVSAPEINKNVRKSCLVSNDKEERIVLISPYGEGDDSDTEIEADTRIVKIVKDDSDIDSLHVPAVDLPEKEKSPKPKSNSNSENEEDDIDLLTQIQNRAKVLRDLGGELPPDVKKLVDKNGTDLEEEPNQKHVKKEKKDVTGFSLLAGYGDSNDEEEEEEKGEETTKTEVVSSPTSQTSHSTLFPVPQPIDIKQFSQAVKKEEQEVKKSESLEIPNVVDSRVFHRKRRIGIDLVDSRKPKLDIKVDAVEIDRQGFGFKSENETDLEGTKCSDAKVGYPGFKSGGLMFIKSHVLRPRIQLENKDQSISEDSIDSKETMLKIEEIRKTLNEKLLFLNEGRDTASPVQIMIIQMETLYEAAKEGSLTVSYLHRWLKETCSELVKLEKDAAPSGWLLQWDRINKRYYYRNQQTGDSQWEYPQPDIVGGDEAMDISTTPPPPVIESDDVLPPIPIITTMPLQPPPPPRIKSPTPPPPPSISKNVKQKKKGTGKSHRQPPLPPEIPPSLPPLPVENLSTLGEPLPPGVDLAEVTSYEPLVPPAAEIKPPSNTNDTLGSALNSFYSDLAALETEATAASMASVVNVVVPIVQSQCKENVVHDNVIHDTSLKKKKKTKVKLVQGLAMKKKGVSKLVERWKNVQKDY